MTGNNLSSQVRVRELIGWDLDDNEFRPGCAAQSIRLASARAIVSSRARFEAANPIDPIVKEMPASIIALLADHARRDDLQREMQGLDWSLGIVELPNLLAFQRRLIFDPEYARATVPAAGVWPALTAFAFGASLAATFTTLSSTPAELVVQSASPNLQLRRAAMGSPGAFEFHGGSPFFEVAEYRGRWFLRDGYHRAELLLRNQVSQVPAVIIRARTLEELGPIGPWFFSEQVLFSAHPPYVSDFLDEQLTLEYIRPRMLKTLRVSIQESFAPAMTAPIKGEPR